MFRTFEDAKPSRHLERILVRFHAETWDKERTERAYVVAEPSMTVGRTCWACVHSGRVVDFPGAEWAELPE